ncbi:MAG: UDP-N-acetylmuramoyl-L-alanyl-D-glutamate--2,6-diaminopimelate ligase [Clostridia bacterium]|nr:UDP-N-acetylmuramoyl-L-alanyl-D-glutamate--2,6-diaminopimelate ligase [Clostridia bacterium]
MELKNLLKGIENIKVTGDLSTNITGIESNSKNIQKGNLFVAIKGYNQDGHKYITNAVEAGATAVLIENDCDIEILKQIKDKATIVMVENTRRALAVVSSNYYGNPSSKFKLIGITGTKGKTTTTFMLKQILEQAGKKVGLIGTIAQYINGKKIKESDRTTPESLELQKIFAQMAEEKVEYVIMEVSSQSLKLHRVDQSEFDLVLFTNLSEDHISAQEHADMKEYFEAKLKLFEMCPNGIVNTDDVYGNKIPTLFKDSNITTYGIDNPADMVAKDITITSSYVDFKVKLYDTNERIKVCIPGRFSVYNAMAAITIALKLNIPTEIIKQALVEVRVPGRSEIVDNKKELTIIIDYAHSPESLENILRATKGYARGNVISLFGCGGDRDKRKRPIMGEISGKIADYTIITTDNPRTEEPEQIVKEIEEGIKKTKGKYKVIVDRTKAIETAIKMANKNDVIILAGKGHEPYQEINGVKYPFDERIIVREIIDKLIKKEKNN